MAIAIETIVERNPVERLSPLLFGPDGFANDHLSSISDRITCYLKDLDLASKVLGIYLVGSHVNGTFGENSDVDVRLYVQNMSYIEQRVLEDMLIKHLNGQLLGDTNVGSAEVQFSSRFQGIRFGDMYIAAFNLGSVKKSDVVEIHVRDIPQAGLIYDIVDNKWIKIIF